MIKSIIKILNGDYLFGESEIQTKKPKRIVVQRKLEEETTTSIRDLSKPVEEKLQFEFIAQEEISAPIIQTTEDVDPLFPTGYVRLELGGIEFNELYAVHKINCKYIKIGENLFIKSIVILNENRELDCFSEGENKLVQIVKENNRTVGIMVTEYSGNRDSITIVNGRSI